MALNFPNSPADGDTYEGFYWDATAGIWRRQLSVTNLSDLNTKPINDLDDVSAAAPNDNDLLVYDSATSSWVAEAFESGGNVASDAIQPNSNEITEDYTFEANQNGVSAGPITIASGVTVTVGATSAWSIV